MDNDLQNQIQQGIKDYMDSSQYGVTKIPSHLHNGVDTSRISQKDIISSDIHFAFYIEDVSEDFTINNVPKYITELNFSGFAANNKVGAATKRAIINGKVFFGKAYTYTGSGTAISMSSTPNVSYSFIQSGNSMYVDSTDLTKNRVGASQGLYDPVAHTGGFVTVTDDTGAVVASLGVKSFVGDTITLTSFLGTNWKIQGLLTII